MIDIPDVIPRNTYFFPVEMDYITQYLDTHHWHTTAGEIFDRLVEMYLFFCLHLNFRHSFNSILV